MASIPGSTLTLAPFPFPIFLVFVGWDHEGADLIGIEQSLPKAHELLDAWINQRSKAERSCGHYSFIQRADHFGPASDDGITSMIGERVYSSDHQAEDEHEI